MDILLESLEQILSNEVQLHEQLLEVLQEEAESIGQVAPSALLRLQSLKQRHSHKIATLEKQRVKVVQELAQTWNVAVDALPLSQIIVRVPQPIAENLQQCFNQLKALIPQIQQLAHKNGLLSQTRLKSIELSLQFIHEWHKKQKTYSVAGTLKSASEKISRTSI